MRYVDVFEAKNLATRLLNQRITEQLKMLLETKHLYQRVVIETQNVLEALDVQIVGEADNLRFTGWRLGEVPRMILTPSDAELSLTEKGSNPSPVLCLIVGNVKLFCTKCDGREVFSPIHYLDVTNEIRKLRQGPRVQLPPTSFQLFALTYQCQACMGAPKAFLIRRQLWDLFLEGRSPIEQVEVPRFIPKPEFQLFRDALIAMQTGKILAALFYLRTFIEQFARRQTGISRKATGDEIMEAYHKILPEALRDVMPSLRPWYDQLSESLHAARADVELFKRARVDIERHFDMRRVHGISDAHQSTAVKATASPEQPDMPGGASMKGEAGSSVFVGSLF